MFVLTNQNTLPPTTAAALRSVADQANTAFDSQHDASGKHTDITPNSITLNGAPVGTITTLPIDPALFVASTGGTWTVTKPNVAIFQVIQLGQLVYMVWYIATSTITGSAPTNLYINLPQFQVPLSQAEPNSQFTYFQGGSCQYIDWQHGLASNSGPTFVQNTTVGTSGPASPRIVLQAAPSFNGATFPLSSNLSLTGFCFFPVTAGVVNP